MNLWTSRRSARAARIVGWTAASAVALVALLAIAVLVAGNTRRGRDLIAFLTERLTAGHVQLSGLGGSFPSDLTLERLQLADSRGVWLSAEAISVHWSPLALVERRFRVDRAHAARVDMERTPLGGPPGGKPWIPHLDVTEFSVDVVKLGAELAGAPATLSLRGGGRLYSLEDARAEVMAHRLDMPGDYTLHLYMDPARIAATLKLDEPAGGPLQNILGLPQLGAIVATASVLGPRTALRVELAVQAGALHASAAGSFDLPQRSGDLGYSLTAPAMRPRAELAWTRLALEGRWHGTLAAPIGDGRLDVVGLRLAGGTAVDRLNANVTASRGEMALAAKIDGLEIPGPAAKLFAREPLELTASLRLDRAERPLSLSITHPLMTLRARAVTAGDRHATLELKLPDVAPFATLAGQDVRGDASLKAQLTERGDGWSITATTDLGLSGGNAAWIPLLGHRVTLDLAGAVSDRKLSVEHLNVRGRPLILAVEGSATRRNTPATAGPATARPATARPATARPAIDAYIEDLQARWSADIADLALIRPELKGVLHAAGRLSGAPSSLTSDAELSSTLSIRGSPTGTVRAQLHARGLPSTPSGTLKASGDLDGAPITLALALERSRRGGVRAVIQQGEWKSAHLEGDVELAPLAANSRGQASLRFEQLGDLDRLLGIELSGSLRGSAVLTGDGGHAQAQFQLAGRDLAAGPFSGSLDLSGTGAMNGIALTLSAQAPSFMGAPAKLTAAAQLNLEAHRLSVPSALVDYRGAVIQLLAPAQLSFADGFTIEQLKLGAQQAVLQMSGELAPRLDLHAVLHHIDPNLINAILPGALAEGTVGGQMYLEGSLAAPRGTITLAATGLRSASDEAAGLPALDLRASAKLAGDTASVEAHLDAQGASLLTVTGSVPLDVDGALDLKLLGKLDIGLANSYLEARGMRAGGQLTVNATVQGSAAKPEIHGTLALVAGNWRDYVRGVSLTNIGAEVIGSEGTLQIKTFKASAATGSIGMTGSIGVLQSGLPVDLEVTASKAQPITSNILTVNLDSDIHVKGTAREHLDVDGKIHVNRALIGIPDSLPPDVAVLDVRRRGQRAPPQAGKLVVALDLTVQAPQQVLVQGRGLDAELGGEIHVTGTVATPVVTGGFDLQRGSFSIGGNKLTLTPPGRVSFDDVGLKKSIDPTLDFTAQSTVLDTTVTVQVSGHADSPKFDFSSNPQQPQDQILALLLFGEPAAQLSPLQLAEVGAALATLGGVGGGGPNPLVKLQRALGLDRLNVGTNTTTTATGATESSGAAISAGRYVSKRVYIEAKQTTAGNSQIQVNVDLTKRLKLQTRIGNSTAVTQGTTPENDPGSSIGLSYQFEY